MYKYKKSFSIFKVWDLTASVFMLLLHVQTGAMCSHTSLIWQTLMCVCVFIFSSTPADIIHLHVCYSSRFILLLPHCCHFLFMSVMIAFLYFQQTVLWHPTTHNSSQLYTVYTSIPISQPRVTRDYCLPHSAPNLLSKVYFTSVQLCPVFYLYSLHRHTTSMHRLTHNRRRTYTQTPGKKDMKL